jgi:5-methylcytosine-specific restriction endonuclease McrA
MSLKNGKIVKCTYCNAEMYRRLSQINRSTQYFCCNEHQIKYRAENGSFKGEKNPSYNRHEINKTLWVKLRHTVYRRDKYTCQICNKTKCMVYAHHIVPYRASKDNSLSNLITLCPQCHSKEEIKYYRHLRS